MSENRDDEEAICSIVKPHSFKDYIDFESKEPDKSKAIWEPEFVKYCELSDKYLVLTSGLKISNEQELLPARLLLEVESQMYGIGSQLLRRRVTDAMMGLRRAIEATGVAYRVWKYPALAEIFFRAYPWAEQVGHPKQWKASNEYKNEFNTAKLFGEPGDIWNTLKIGYQVLSAMSSHAGPGVISSQELRKGYYFAHFVETSDSEIRRSWYYSMSMLFASLRVFLTMFRQSLCDSVAHPLEKEILIWRDSAAAQMDKRALCMKPHEKASPIMNLIIKPGH